MVELVVLTSKYKYIFNHNDDTFIICFILSQPTLALALPISPITIAR